MYGVFLMILMTNIFVNKFEEGLSNIFNVLEFNV